MKDIKPLFNWAREHGDSNIYDRILITLMPQLLKENIELTSNMIETMEIIEIPNELYELFLEKTEELVGEKYV